MRHQDPKEIFGRRLEQGRRMRGLSLRKLSEATGNKVSYNAIHRYESGEMMPGDEILISLADALDKPLDFFFRPFAVELTGVQFRKKSALGSKTTGAIEEMAADFFERYLEVEQALGFPLEFNDPLTGISIRKPEDAEKAAETVRSKWNLGEDPIPNVMEALEKNGIKVFEVEAPEGMDGFSDWADSYPVIVLASWLDKDLPRKRFTALHEAAHLLIHPHCKLKGKDLESCCHRFAGAMFFPREVFVAELGGFRHRISLDELISLKVRYGMSIAAIMHRALDLGQVDSSTYKRFAMIYRKNGWHRQEPGEYCCPEKSTRFEQLVMRATVEENISMSKGAALLGKTLDQFQDKMSGFA
jgi:Zn-dependent peptidase ImmA (M78 family)/transcriptional regulator with XRE-family HTH domain